MKTTFQVLIYVTQTHTPPKFLHLYFKYINYYKIVYKSSDKIHLNIIYYQMINNNFGNKKNVILIMIYEYYLN